MSQNPYSFSNQPQGAYPTAGQDGVSVLDPLINSSGWLKFTGWVFIIGGVLYCLTIVGIIFGWIPIWMGILLKRAGDSLSQLRQFNNPNLAVEASKDLGTFFTIMGVMTIISMVMSVLWLGFIIFVSLIGAIAAPA